MRSPADRERLAQLPAGNMRAPSLASPSTRHPSAAISPCGRRTRRNYHILPVSELRFSHLEDESRKPGALRLVLGLFMDATCQLELGLLEARGDRDIDSPVCVLVDWPLAKETPDDQHKIERLKGICISHRAPSMNLRRPPTRESLRLLHLRPVAGTISNLFDPHDFRHGMTLSTIGRMSSELLLAAAMAVTAAMRVSSFVAPSTCASMFTAASLARASNAIV